MDTGAFVCGHRWLCLWKSVTLSMDIGDFVYICDFVDTGNFVDTGDCLWTVVTV